MQGFEISTNIAEWTTYLQDLYSYRKVLYTVSGCFILRQYPKRIRNKNGSCHKSLFPSKNGNTPFLDFIRSGPLRKFVGRLFYPRGVYLATFPMTQNMELMAQGAEARLYKGVYLGKTCLVKERFVKKYRHPELDIHLTKDRIKTEARTIVRAKSAGIATPSLYLVDLERRSIYMEYIENATVLKDFIDENISGKTNVDHLLGFIGHNLGAVIARLHFNHIIHGDLTTSNILLKNGPIDPIKSESNESEAATRFVMIDFGLARVDSTPENKAVDLFVLERSLASAHSEVPLLFSHIFESYCRHYRDKSQCKQIISKYKQVQARGRKRLMIG